jgi:hypothetical protein
MKMIHRKKGYGTLHNPYRFSVGPFLFHVGVARRVRGRKKVFRSGTFADDYYNSQTKNSIHGLSDGMRIKQIINSTAKRMIDHTMSNHAGRIIALVIIWRRAGIVS